jgi:hypothetical protein
MLPPVFVELKANIGEFTAKMGEAKTEIRALEKEGSSSYKKLQAVGKAAFLGLSAAAIGVGVMSVHMADQFEISHAKLETALQNAGTSYEEFQGQIKAATDAQTKFGFNSTETEAALATLTTSLHDPKKALDDLSLATDLAKFKGLDLQSAALLVAKAQQGQLKPLKALGIDLPVVASSAAKLASANAKLTKAQEALQAIQADPKKTAEKLAKAQDKVATAQDKVNKLSSAGTEIIKGLSAAIGGQAAAQSETLGGKINELKAEAENLFTTIGMKIVPVLIKMVDAIKEASHWMGEHKLIVELVAGAIAGPLVVAIGAYTIGMIAAAAATIAAALPFIAIGVAVMGVILAIKYVHDHMDEIIKNIKEKFHAFKEAVVSIFDGIKEKFSSIWSGLGNAVKQAFSTVGDIVKGYFNIYIGFFNHVIDQLNKIHVSLPSALGGGSFGVNINHIPLLAQGGIVNSPTLAMIGEAGPEAVIPLSKMNAMGSGINVTINVTGSVVQERDLAVTVRDNIAQLMRQRGLNPSILGV